VANEHLGERVGSLTEQSDAIVGRPGRTVYANVRIGQANLEAALFSLGSLTGECNEHKRNAVLVPTEVAMDIESRHQSVE
jgi:hypothetical protein